MEWLRHVLPTADEPAMIASAMLLPSLLGLAALPFAHAAYAAWVRRRYPRAGEQLDFHGSRLHFTRSGEGPLVVLVHGANGTGHDFPAELVRDLERDHTVLAFDRPGHGWSEAPAGPLGLAENAAALRALLEAQGARNATVVGHSYGAAVALRAAIEAPERVGHVVAVTPCTAIDARNERYARAPMVGGPPGRLLFQFIALPLLPLALPLRAQAWHPERPPRGWTASRAFAYVPSQMHASARNFRTLHADMAWLERHLGSLRARLTVIAGAMDLVTPPERHVAWLSPAFPAATVEVLPRAGHWLVRLRPEVVTAAVRRHSGAQPGSPNGR
jgi:pimeloyl-ACP methyl ester carboxylesterase